MGATDKTFACAIPGETSATDRIVMAHGGGGRMSQRLFDSVFLPAFACDELKARHDGAAIAIGGVPMAFSTDTYVVRPIEFPGGNIGDLAVNGTVNDLAMCGAQPLYLSAGFILEEGLAISTLRRVVDSMRAAAARAGVRFVTGDTKVVDRGKADGLYINTAGIGLAHRAVSPAAIEPGDAILVSGDLGSHGIAILSVREGLAFDAPVLSDTAALWPAVQALLEGGIDVHCLRDLTRGGLSSALNEIAQVRGCAIRVDEAAIPVREVVAAACDLLGLDPLYVANEGRFAAFVPGGQADAALEILRRVEVSCGASRIGTVLSERGSKVYLRTRVGGTRIVDMISGEQLPRIC